MIKRSLLMVSCLFFTSCATTEVYNSPSTSEESAVIKFQAAGRSGAAFAFEGQSVFLKAINGKDVSFWRLSDNTRLSPGVNHIYVMGIADTNQSRAFADLVLDVKAGESYLVKKEDEIEDIKFYITDRRGQVVAEAKGRKKGNDLNS